ncbi:MAG TPA: hypothetical protein VLD17_09455 [Gemmatimonadaceae bacterium]|nr:hypothetical protein [Gemmatimonadaceae bacterium]
MARRASALSVDGAGCQVAGASRCRTIVSGTAPSSPRAPNVSARGMSASDPPNASRAASPMRWSSRSSSLAEILALSTAQSD